MTEWIHLALIGWRNYTSQSKTAGLLLIAVLLLCFWWKKVDRKQFVLYTAVTAVLLICPLTAALGLMYQTRFYDYEWLWSAVPTTALTAYAVVLLLTELAEKKEKKDRLRLGVVTAILLAAVFLSGISEVTYDFETEEVEILPTQKELRAGAEAVLQAARENFGEGKMLLAAPSDVLLWSRELDSSVELLYGRNMWDKKLNAYTYDTYPEDYETVYRFIEGTDGEIAPETAAEILARTGVNCLILKDSESEETAELLADRLQMQLVRAAGCYILYRS